MVEPQGITGVGGIDTYMYKYVCGGYTYTYIHTHICINTYMDEEREIKGETEKNKEKKYNCYKIIWTIATIQLK
jgi:hypothetical protein